MNKKKYLMISTFLILILSSIIYITAYSYSGDGTIESPYLISNADELYAIRNSDKRGAYFKLIADIDLENLDRIPIGTYSANAFTGYFDGDGHTIKNFMSRKYGGIFGFTSNATIKNIILENADVNVEGGVNLGSLVGAMDGGTLENCHVIGIGQVKGNDTLGGLVGKTYNQPTIIGCSANIPVEGIGGGIGGLVGFNTGTITNSLAKGDVSSSGNSVGGLVGVQQKSNNKIEKCYATGNVTGANYVGGLLGSDYSENLIISECYAMGNVNGNANAGGLVGYSSVSELIKNSFSGGDVTAAQNCGGFIGSAQFTTSVANCFSAGKVNCEVFVGGLIGFSTNKNKMQNIVNCFFDSSVSGISDAPGQALSSAQSKIKSNYAGWDFDSMWSINDGEGYPYLKSLPNPFIEMNKINLSVESKTDTTVSLSWQSVNEGAVYEIYINNELSDTTTSTNYEVGGLTQNTEYTFSVRTEDGISSEFITVKTRVSGVATGDGTLKSPYLISTADELYAIGNGSTEHYKLANNIDLKDMDRVSISALEDNAFKGYFDGNGFTIRNFMTRESKGLFGYTSGATIKNVTLENVDIDVTDGIDIGSLIGSMDGGELENCTVRGVGQVKGYGSLGGLVGKTTNNALIKNCDVTISVIGSGSNIGGLVGDNTGTITNCIAKGDVTSSGDNAGGLVGRQNGNGSEIKKSFATGSVTGINNVGGFLGADKAVNLAVKECYSSGGISGSTNVGGFIGYGGSALLIENSFSIGDVTALKNAGGFIGYSEATTKILYCLTVSNVYGKSDFGGFVGYIPKNAKTQNIINCYFDSSVSGITEPAEQSRTTKQLESKSNYAGWNFDTIWNIRDGENYPYMQVLPNPIADNTIAGFKATGENLYNMIKESISAQEEVARKMADEIPKDDVIDVTEYGVIGDGITKNTEAFKNAIERAQNTGKTLYFPDGVYDLGISTLEIKKNISIRGQSSEHTKIINAPKIYPYMDVSIENVSISTSEGILLFLKPNAFQTLYLNNVKFSGVYKDNPQITFAYCSIEDGSAGYSNIEIINCEATNCNIMLNIECKIESARIEKNIIYDLGSRDKVGKAYGMILGFKNKLTGLANNTLIKNNYIKGLYKKIDREEHGYENESRGILVYGNKVNIEENYLEDIVGGRGSEGIYTKAFSSRIINNTMYNAGDSQGSIVHKGIYESEDRVVVKGNRMILDKCFQDIIIHSGICLQTDYADVIDNYINMNNGMGISGSYLYTREANIIGNEIIINGRNAIQIQLIDGKISIKENRITFVPNYEPVFEGATVTLPDSVITLKSVKEGSSFDISNNVINSKEKRILNFFSLADNLKADINDNYFDGEEVTGALFALANLPYNFNGNTVVYKRNDNLNPGTNNYMIYSELDYGAQHLEDNTFICDGDKTERLIWLHVTAKELNLIESDTITVKNNTFKILKGGLANACIYYRPTVDMPGKNVEFSGNILENAGKVNNLFLLYNSSRMNYGNLTFIGNKGRVDDKLIGCTTANFPIVADSMTIQDNDITLKADVLIAPKNIPVNMSIVDIS